MDTQVIDWTHSRVITMELIRLGKDPVTWFDENTSILACESAEAAIDMVCKDTLILHTAGNPCKEILDYCTEHNISIEEFNQPISIAPVLTDCSFALCGCKSFNNPVYIPETVECCDSMFLHCKSLNSNIVIDDGPKKFNHFMAGCSSFNYDITLPQTMQEMEGAFDGCFNMQSAINLPSPKGLWIPSDAKVQLYQRL